MPRPNRSSTKNEYISVTKDVPMERDYELNVQTDMTRKQFATYDEDEYTPSRAAAESIKDDNRTTEKKSVKKPSGLMLGLNAAPVERSLSQRLMQVTRSVQPLKNNFTCEQSSAMSELLKKKNQESTILMLDETGSQMTGQKTNYETADQVVV